MNGFSIGQHVYVIADTMNHGFKYGQKVIITKMDCISSTCRSKDGEYASELDELFVPYSDLSVDSPIDVIDSNEEINFKIKEAIELDEFNRIVGYGMDGFKNHIFGRDSEYDGGGFKGIRAGNDRA